MLYSYVHMLYVIRNTTVGSFGTEYSSDGMSWILMPQQYKCTKIQCVNIVWTEVIGWPRTDISCCADVNNTSQRCKGGKARLFFRIRPMWLIWHYNENISVTAHILHMSSFMTSSQQEISWMSLFTKYTHIGF